MQLEKFIITVAFIALISSACSPSEGAVQTAIAQTQASMPTLTPSATFEPTHTLIPTETSTPIPTITSTNTPSPTPDLRIIDTDPQKLLCAATDLPEKGGYYIPNETWSSINTNEEVISIRGVEKGRDYVISTERITGWWVAHNRAYRSARLPEELFCGVYLFKTAKGAQLAVTKYNSVESEPKEGFVYVNKPLEIGDKSIIIARYKIDSGGDKNTNYEIEFSYRNIMVNVSGYAKTEEDVPHEVIEALARVMLEKLIAEPLIDPENAVLAR